MDISSISIVAASAEGARNAGIQQAVSSANSDDTQRSTKKQSQELNLKTTETVSGTTNTNGSDTKTHKVNVLA